MCLFCRPQFVFAARKYNVFQDFDADKKYWNSIFEAGNSELLKVESFFTTTFKKNTFITFTDITPGGNSENLDKVEIDCQHNPFFLKLYNLMQFKLPEIMENVTLRSQNELEIVTGGYFSVVKLIASAISSYKGNSTKNFL